MRYQEPDAPPPPKSPPPPEKSLLDDPLSDDGALELSRMLDATSAATNAFMRLEPSSEEVESVDLRRLCKTGWFILRLLIINILSKLKC
jgi:hypothetical protein